MDVDEEFFGYRRGYELYEFIIEQRLLIEGMSDDLLKKSISILKHENKRRKKDTLKFVFAFFINGNYRNF